MARSPKPPTGPRPIETLVQADSLARFGRWAFAEFSAVFEIQRLFDELIAEHCAIGAAA